MVPATEYKKAGFWLRLIATWIDCLIVWCILKLCFYILLYIHPVYFPFNFTFFVLGILYSIISIAAKGQTPGKYLTGLTVLSNNNERLSLLNSILRESVGKFVSAVIVFLGFLWIGFSKKKVGWHDYLCKSNVQQSITGNRYTKYWRLFGTFTLIVFFGNFMWQFTSVITDATKIGINRESLRFPFMNRNPADATDITQIKDTGLVTWLDKNAATPENYLLQMASSHQVTLLAEEHEDADNLIFLNNMIAPLYHKAGVRVIGMEVISAAMNKKVERLITAKTYDSTLALEIARLGAWQFWGFKEYWDVLKTAWQLNHSLPENAEKLRIVGITPEYEMANFSLLSSTNGNAKGKSAFWEKFRIISAIQEFPRLLYNDNIMARNVEKEILGKNKKGVILVGFEHTMINYVRSVIQSDKIILGSPKFGVLLNQKYPGKLFQIELFHRLDFSETDDSLICKNNFDAFRDSVFKQNGNRPCGFTVAASPFEKLRDNCSPYWAHLPSVYYGDIAQGLIFLKPIIPVNRCTWMDDYVSDEMIMKYKPMYDLMLQRIGKTNKYINAKELNALMKTVK